MHLEYILTEILKNSFRATVEQHTRLQRAAGLLSLPSLPPVVITISPPEPREDTSKAGSAFLSIRIRDQGGGVLPSNVARIFSYAFTTAGRGETEFGDAASGGPYAAQHVGGSAAVGEGDTGLFSEIAGKGLQAGLGTIAGLGYGLPMSRLYAK